MTCLISWACVHEIKRVGWLLSPSSVSTLPFAFSESIAQFHLFECKIILFVSKVCQNPEQCVKTQNSLKLAVGKPP